MAATAFAMRGRVALLKICKPPVNSLGLAVRKGIVEGLEQAQQQGAGALVIAGDGGTFPAGADITEFAKGGHLVAPSLGPGVCEVLSRANLHTVAAVHGTALGGGMEVALSCHYRLMHETAKFGLPEVHLGLLPGAGGTQRLPRLVGCEMAIQWMTTGQMISAKAALANNLADELVPASKDVPAGEAVIQRAVEFAQTLLDEPIDPERVVANRTLPDPGEQFFTAARAAVSKKARGEVAPTTIVDAVKASVGAPSFEEGLVAEGELFMGLEAGKQAPALQQVFTAERQIGKIDSLPKGVQPNKVAAAAVIGAGTMGGGIAMCFAEAGLPVTLLDQSEEALQRGMAIVRGNWEAKAKKGKLSAEQVEALVGRITPATEYAAIGQADVVVEAAFERMDIKKVIFGELDKHMKAGAILASNTSTLSIDEIASATSRPEAVVGMHFFSPANVMPLLENVRGAASSPEAIATAMALGKKLRKKAVLAGNCFGFIGNRMLENYVREAALLLEEGATCQQVDAVMSGLGMAMGPFTMGDLAGNDIGYNIRKDNGWDASWAAANGNQRYWGHLADALVEMGRAGQKTKGGWYDYPKGRVPVPSATVEAMIQSKVGELGIPQRAISDTEILDRCLLPLVNEGFRIIQEGIAQRESDLNIVYIYGYGFPRATGGPMHWARHIREGGLPQVVADIRKYGEAHPDVPYWQPSDLLVAEAEKAAAK